MARRRRDGSYPVSTQGGFGQGAVLSSYPSLKVGEFEVVRPKEVEKAADVPFSSKVRTIHFDVNGVRLPNGPCSVADMVETIWHYGQVRMKMELSDGQYREHDLPSNEI